MASEFITLEMIMTLVLPIVAIAGFFHSRKQADR